MRYLIDTNVLINHIEDNISDKVLEIINDYNNIIYVSSESIREIIILTRNNRIESKKKNFELDIFNFVENELGFKVKYIAKEHLKTLASLKIVDGHNDPFDHLIIAHAMTEKIPVISNDTYFPKYRKQGLDLIYNR